MQRILQVGHLERFNAAILAAEPYLKSTRFIECHRLAPYRERGTDVNVVLDLMIHDIDIVQTIVGAPVASIDAVGTPVFSDEIDIANARIRFANGCIANATASRVSLKTERKLRIFEDDAYLSLDLQQKIMTLIRKRTAADGPGPLPVTIEEQSLEQGDALKAEIESFLGCIRDGRPPVVSGEAGPDGARDRHAHHRAGGRGARRAPPHARSLKHEVRDVEGARAFPRHAAAGVGGGDPDGLRLGRRRQHRARRAPGARGRARRARR